MSDKRISKLVFDRKINDYRERNNWESMEELGYEYGIFFHIPQIITFCTIDKNHEIRMQNATVKYEVIN